ncbi:MAG: bifunctional riboflavin kinase/FAD synthetase [Gemmatimonadota bacterium]
MLAHPALESGTTVTVGTFDGVHRGHHAVLQEIVRRARRAGRKSLLVTFEPHPLEVVKPAAAPLLLTTGLERREALAQTEIDYAVFLRFDRTMAAMSPDTFVREVLRRQFGMQELVIGYDHGFGRGRSGDVETLKRLGVEDGFLVDVVPPVESGGQAVSSTQVRRAVSAGDLAGAARLLGRNYSVTGQVVPGAGRGRTIGIPTVNLGQVPANKLLPPDGVYAAWVETPSGRFGAMLNQGARPTFGEQGRSLEAHLFNFSGNLYGRWLRIEWIERLRETKKFNSAEELMAQLDRDRDAATHVLQGTKK